MRRDSQRLLDEDNFQIILDTFHDSRSGYMFVTSPLGAKLEQQIAEEGEGGFGRNSPNINVNWDGVWHVSSRRTDQGWVSEIAIPIGDASVSPGGETGLGRELHAEHPPEERAGVLGADPEGLRSPAVYSALPARSPA